MVRLTAWVAVAASVAVCPWSALAAQQVTAIRAGRLVDVDKGPVVGDQLIVVRGDRIESLQPGSSRPPAGVRVVDLSRHTVAPGLIDCHTHLIGDVQAAPLTPLERSGAQEASDRRTKCSRHASGRLHHRARHRHLSGAGGCSS